MKVEIPMNDTPLKSRKILRYSFSTICCTVLGAAYAFMIARCIISDLIWGTVIFSVFAAFCLFALVFSVSAIKKGSDSVSSVSLILAALAVFTLILPFTLSWTYYEFTYDKYYMTPMSRIRYIEEFDGLQCEECSFDAFDGKAVCGYKYYKDPDAEKKGVLVTSHGLGNGGQNAYMDIADKFASNGYIVFAYDAVGNDKSDRNTIGGLCRAVADIDSAVSYVESRDDMKDLPVVLFGHSWGGYAVCNALSFHPEVKGIVSVAGFDASADLALSEGLDRIGWLSYLTLPYISAYESFIFGKYADSSALDSFEKTDAEIMILQSENDRAVPREYGYDKYFEKYGDDERFTFKLFEDRGHSGIYYTDAARAYRDEFDDELDEMIDSTKPEDEDTFREEYTAEFLDRTKRYELDEEIMSEMIQFFDNCIK